jgi:hypothetical protein
VPFAATTTLAACRAAPLLAFPLRVDGAGAVSIYRTYHASFTTLPVFSDNGHFAGLRSVHISATIMLPTHSLLALRDAAQHRRWAAFGYSTKPIPLYRSFGAWFPFGVSWTVGVLRPARIFLPKIAAGTNACVKTLRSLRDGCGRAAPAAALPRFLPFR